MSGLKNNHHNRRRKPTLLIVDDSENVAKTVAMVLEQAGFRTVVAHTSEQGLFAAISNAVDLALIDVNLPDADGFNTAVKLCKRLPHCKILLFSGDDTTNEILAKAKADGIDFPILAKPVPPEQLLSTVRSLLAGNATRLPT